MKMKTTLIEILRIVVGLVIFTLPFFALHYIGLGVALMIGFESAKHGFPASIIVGIGVVGLVTWAAGAVGLILIGARVTGGVLLSEIQAARRCRKKRRLHDPATPQ